MKISRFKKSQRILSFYTTHFNYHRPYQVLIDATFCQKALQKKVIIDEQIEKYLQSPVKLLTTQCIILEVESFGSRLNGATMIVKKFPIHKCGHEGQRVSAAECIKSMTKVGRYIIASQDRELQDRLRKVPGRCLLYLHNATPVLEKPSPASKKYVLKKSKNVLPEELLQRIDYMKKSNGVSNKEGTDDKVKKHKKPKNPNPLSCKKSKKSKVVHYAKEAQNTSTKPKRRRIKIAPHVKEALMTGSS